MKSEQWLLSYADVEALIGINRSTLATWVFAKTIPHYKLSKRSTRFDKHEIEEWLRSHYVPVKRNNAFVNKDGECDEQ